MKFCTDFEISEFDIFNPNSGDLDPAIIGSIIFRDILHEERTGV